MVQLREANIRAYAEAWLERSPDGLIPPCEYGAVEAPEPPEVTGPEREVALVLVGYDTPSHGAMMGVSQQARNFAAAHFPEGL